MSDYSKIQIADLLKMMPEVMAHLRARRDAHDADAERLFAELDTYCWHQPVCPQGVMCEGGKPPAPPYCPRCNRYHTRDGEAEEKCQRGMQFARADHRRRGGVE